MSFRLIERFKPGLHGPLIDTLYFYDMSEDLFLAAEGFYAFGEIGGRRCLEDSRDFLGTVSFELGFDD